MRFHSRPTITFVIYKWDSHQDQLSLLSLMKQALSIFSTASTCSLTLKLPLTLTSYDKIKDKDTMAF